MSHLIKNLNFSQLLFNFYYKEITFLFKILRALRIDIKVINRIRFSEPKPFFAVHLVVQLLDTT